MKKNLTIPILNAALVVLLSVLVAPDRFGRLAEKDAFFYDTDMSVVGIQPKSLGDPGKDKPEFTHTREWAVELPAQESPSYSPSPARAPRFTFTVHQARAPPLT